MNLAVILKERRYNWSLLIETFHLEEGVEVFNQLGEGTSDLMKAIFIID